MYPVVVLVYGLHLLLALPVFFSFRSALASVIGNFSATASLLKDFDFTTVADFLRVNGSVISAVCAPVSWLALLALLLMIFLKGGIVASLTETAGTFSLKEFFAHCGAFWWRLFRLFLLLGGALCVSIIALVVIAAAGFTLLTEDAGSEVPQQIAILVTGVVSLVVLAGVLTLADYARIFIVGSDAASVVPVARQAVRFVFRNPGATLGVLAFSLLSWLLLLAAYFIAVNGVGMTSVARVALCGAFQQITVLARDGLSVFCTGAQVSLVERRIEVSENPVAPGAASMDPLLAE
jgi:hypothetical protein